MWSRCNFLSRSQSKRVSRSEKESGQESQSQSQSEQKSQSQSEQKSQSQSEQESQSQSQSEQESQSQSEQESQSQSEQESQSQSQSEQESQSQSEQKPKYHMQSDDFEYQYQHTADFALELSPYTAMRSAGRPVHRIEYHSSSSARKASKRVARSVLNSDEAEEGACTRPTQYLDDWENESNTEEMGSNKDQGSSDKYDTIESPRKNINSGHDHDLRTHAHSHIQSTYITPSPLSTTSRQATFSNRIPLNPFLPMKARLDFSTVEENTFDNGKEKYRNKSEEEEEKEDNVTEKNPYIDSNKNIDRAKFQSQPQSFPRTNYPDHRHGTDQCSGINYGPSSGISSGDDTKPVRPKNPFLGIFHFV